MTILKMKRSVSREGYLSVVSCTFEREDFMENPPKIFQAGTWSDGTSGAYIIRCDNVVKDEHGNVTEVHCSYIPESKSSNDTSSISVKGTLHWVSVARTAVSIELRLYDRLFRVVDPSNEEGDFKDYINPDSLQVITAYAEPALKTARFDDRCEFLLRIFLSG